MKSKESSKVSKCYGPCGKCGSTVGNFKSIKIVKSTGRSAMEKRCEKCLAKV